MAIVNRSVYAVLTFSDTASPSDLIVHHGRPTMDTRTISTLSGYIQCSNASIECAALDIDKDTINGYLNSGFYYE